MKISKLLLALSCALTLFVSCNSAPEKLEQKVEYLGHSIMIPKDWENKTSEAAGGAVHQILCNRKDGERLVLLQWLDTESEPEAYMDITKQAMKDQPMFADAKYSDNTTGTFQGNPSIYFDFSGTFSDFKYSGRLVVFKLDGKIYHIHYYAGKANDKTMEAILNSITLGKSTPQ